MLYEVITNLEKIIGEVMKFNNIDFIDFESKNVLTQKTSLVIFMGIFVFGFYTMAVSFVITSYSIHYTKLYEQHT